MVRPVWSASTVTSSADDPMINVTKSYLPDRRKFDAYLDRIFASGQLTNGGPLVKELQARLEDYLGVRHVLLVANGTMALTVAYRLLGLEGRVITTPFSFVATASSIAWQGLEVGFADIDADSLTMDPARLAASDLNGVSAVVPVHVFGNPCDVPSIERIAGEHGLKVIYDAAHAFGVDYDGKSLLTKGDVSVLSLHATKLFHTFEGGALIINDDELYAQACRMINFGIVRQESIACLGINAKMNEVEAAMGLCILDDMDKILAARAEICEDYDRLIGDHVSSPSYNSKASRNYSHYPVLFRDEASLLQATQMLNEQGINPRRYFCPSLDTLDFLYRGEAMAVSRDVASRVLCLPLYPGLDKVSRRRIAECVNAVA